ncbi:MAG: DUF1538 domain-containing protein [Tissierellia bacterium]|nr:DUF1538 domain-containing protein [Tissierellia bacterium]
MTVLPISILVLILHFTLTPLGTPLLVRFLLGSVAIVLGLTVFLLGVDIGITPIGQAFGKEIIQTNKLMVVALAGLILGFVISVAEPDLHILAGQVDAISSGVVGKSLLVLVVSLGVALMVSLGLVRIVRTASLNRFLGGTYLLILLFGLLANAFFLSIAFDASGSTTGALTVPFLLAISAGVSSLNQDSKKSEEDAFGLVGIASAGAILSVLILGVLTPLDLGEVAPPRSDYSPHILLPFMEELPLVGRDVLMALLPIVLIYLLADRVFFKQGKRDHAQIAVGLLMTYLGLVVFLLGVGAGFMDAGRFIGEDLASQASPLILVATAFLMGVLTILAEPAVHVLTDQIEDVTAGYVKKRTVLGALSLGVGLAVALSIVKILLPAMMLWHVLLPGYILSFILAFRVPRLFVGIAFDSGGVASGPMTATFILAYAQGIASSLPTADLLLDGFGTIAMVAMTPLIALQTLGLVYDIKSKKED